jgi:1-acyl-sn-glycerol-3-phosphate acyltransferase
MLGTEKLNAIGPWLPMLQAKIWVAYGRPIYPPAGVKSTRASRRELSERLAIAYRELYGRLCSQFGLTQ